MLGRYSSFIFSFRNFLASVFGNDFSEIIIEGMDNLFCRFSFFKFPKVFHHCIAHSNKGIAGFKKIFCERFVTRSFFMWQYIIGNRNNFCFTILASSVSKSYPVRVP